MSLTCSYYRREVFFSFLLSMLSRLGTLSGPLHFVFVLSSYQTTLKQLFREFESGDDSNSQLAAVTMRIMQALQTNLDGKSKQYKDPALSHLFLMNNIHYMVRSVRRFVYAAYSFRVLVLWKYLLTKLFTCLLFPGLKRRTCWGMIGSKGIEG